MSNEVWDVLKFVLALVLGAAPGVIAVIRNSMYTAVLEATIKAIEAKIKTEDDRIVDLVNKTERDLRNELNQHKADRSSYLDRRDYDAIKQTINQTEQSINQRIDHYSQRIDEKIDSLGKLVDRMLENIVQK